MYKDILLVARLITEDPDIFNEADGYEHQITYEDLPQQAALVRGRSDEDMGYRAGKRDAAIKAGERANVAREKEKRAEGYKKPYRTDKPSGRKVGREKMLHKNPAKVISLVLKNLKSVAKIAPMPKDSSRIIRGAVIGKGASQQISKAFELLNKHGFLDKNDSYLMSKKGLSAIKSLSNGLLPDGMNADGINELYKALRKQ